MSKRSDLSVPLPESGSFHGTGELSLSQRVEIRSLLQRYQRGLSTLSETVSDIEAVRRFGVEQLSLYEDQELTGTATPDD